MSQLDDYVPPKVWTWTKPSGGTFANVNRPTAGATFDEELPVGRHPLQLYGLVQGWAYGATEFISAHEYQNVLRWADTLMKRPAVPRGRRVSSYLTDLPGRIDKRHDASDLDKALAAIPQE